jgi:hypothetical protein
MRLSMCARKECEICKYKDRPKAELPSDDCKERSTKNMNILADVCLRDDHPTEKAVRMMDYMKRIELENIDEVVDDCKIRKNIVAQIVDMTDKVILETIIEFAKSEGITDLYLLDKEFIKTALVREIARRKGGAE